MGFGRPNAGPTTRNRLADVFGWPVFSCRSLVLTGPVSDCVLFTAGRIRYTAPPMAQTREIKKRMTAVKTIQRITKTMQMIATAKFTAAAGRTKASKPYTDKIRKLVEEVTAAAGDVEHPLIVGPNDPANRELLLVISSDRGLCGAYNTNVLRAAIAHVRTLRTKNIEFDLETSGKKAVAFFKFSRITIQQRHTFGDKPQYDQVDRLASRLIQDYLDGKYNSVRVAYMRFETNTRQVPQVMQLLPMKAEARTPAGDGQTSEAAGAYEFSPTAQELLDDLLPMAIKMTLFQAFNDAVVSEQIMRMVAMKAATENAKDLGRTLRRSFNRARQSQITTELSEIIAGAAALE
jgi:F-type H+-transporting ATPase subunit gamma